MYNFVKRKNICLSLSGILIITSIVFIALGGLKLGIDFTGGSLMKIKFSNPEQKISIAEISSATSDLELGEIKIQETEGQFILKTKNISNEERQLLLTTLQDKLGQVEEQSFESIGPTIGKELQKKASLAIIIVLIAIIIYITWAFRKVSSGPVPSYVYGLAAIIALTHDILITIGAFAVLGHYRSVEVGALFITALLTILGFSVHDTIIIFDRIRETLNRNFKATFEEVINQSINATIIRSLNTTIATLLVLIALALFGGETILYFVIALIIGFVAGTYSSIFIAAPLLLIWKKFRAR